MLKNRHITTSIENKPYKKASVLPKVEIANILNLQFVEIVNLEHVLLNNLKTYIYLKTMSPLHTHKY